MKRTIRGTLLFVLVCGLAFTGCGGATESPGDSTSVSAPDAPYFPAADLVGPSSGRGQKDVTLGKPDVNSTSTLPDTQSVSPPEKDVTLGKPDVNSTSTLPDTQSVSPPETTIMGSPDAVTNAKTATLIFGCDKVSCTFLCQLDTGPWESCSSGVSHSDLSETKHTFRVKAIDQLGYTDPTPAEVSWTVDTTAPTVKLTLTPTLSSKGTTDSRSAAFAFSCDDQNGCTLGCQLDEQSSTLCNDLQKNLVDLSLGAHSFSVHGTDAAGNKSMQTFEWTIVAEYPDTTITVPPPAFTNQLSVSAEFGCEGDACSFECRITYKVGESTVAEAWYACKSGDDLPLPAQLDDAYTLEVRAKSMLGISQKTDPTPASATFRLDRTPPTVTITSAPRRATMQTTASFGFACGSGAADACVKLECKIDQASWQDCSNGALDVTLTEGAHTLEIRGTDQAGNVGLLAPGFTWQIIAPVSEIDPGNADRAPCFITASGMPFCWGLAFHALSFSWKWKTNPSFDDAPIPVAPLGVGWKAVIGTYFLKTDGSLWNLNLGVSLSMTVLDPPPAPDPTGYQSLHRGICARSYWLWAYCWGSNTSGQLGNANGLYLFGGIGPSGLWVDLDVASTFGCGSGGVGLYCWGNNLDGQFGPWDLAILLPKKIADGYWPEVKVGEDTPKKGSGCGIKKESNGAEYNIYCWGYGLPGTGVPMHIAPVKYATGKWRNLVMGDRYACAIDQQDNLYCGGTIGGDVVSASYGYFAHKYEGKWWKVFSSRDRICAIDEWQRLWCWGQLLDQAQSITPVLVID